MGKINPAEGPCIAEDSWQEILRDICEVARNSLHNLVSSGTPPLPRCYHQEFVHAADSLNKQKILEMVRSDEDRQAGRFNSVILKARDRISEARKILVRFEDEAKRNMSELDNSITTMLLHLEDMPEEQKRALDLTVEAFKDSSSGFMRDISGVLEQIGRQESLLASLARKIHEDPLTGVLNRRAWERDLSGLAGGSRLNGTDSPVSIAIADLDNFKNVNDSFGHPVGDAVLKQFALLLKDHFSGLGSVYRYGGEEFGIVLPGCSLEKAAARLELFRKRLHKAVFVAMGGDVKIKITASFGIAQWRTGMEEIKEAVSRADQMLYKAKEAGRDCIKCLQQ